MEEFRGDDGITYIPDRVLSINPIIHPTLRDIHQQKKIPDLNKDFKIIQKFIANIDEFHENILNGIGVDNEHGLYRIKDITRKLDDVNKRILAFNKIAKENTDMNLSPEEATEKIHELFYNCYVSLNTGNFDEIKSETDDESDEKFR